MILRQNKDQFSRKAFRLETGKKYHKQALRKNLESDLTKNLLDNKPNISVEHRQQMFQWIVGVKDTYGFLDNTALLAIKLFDKFVS